LTLLNSPFAREQSMALARRLLQECGEEPERSVARAWQLAFGRPITPNEMDRASLFLRTRMAVLSGAGAAPKPQEDALAELCLALFNTNEFAYVD
jgi:hypothetical protein